MSTNSQTIITQGTFAATGNAIYLPIRSDIDWMEVYNYTESNFATGAGTGLHGVKYYWQRGMAANDGFVWQNNAGATAILQTTSAALAVGGFTLIDSSLQVPGPIIAYSAGTNATPPVITVVSTAGLSTGNIVRLTTSATAYNASGVDYTIEVLNGTTFSLRNMSAPGSVFGAGTFRLIAFDKIFYPRDRIISRISAATQAVVATTVDHGYQVGDLVRMSIPQTVNAAGAALYGSYIALDQQIVTVVAVTAATAGNPATFTINFDTTGFGTFTWPVVANVPFTPASCFAFGYYTDATVVTVPAYPVTNPNNLLDATQNMAFLGMKLEAGITSPAGTAEQVIFWKAGKSFSTTIQPLTTF